MKLLDKERRFRSFSQTLLSNIYCRRWQRITGISSSTDPVHDVAFAPNVGRSVVQFFPDLLMSCERGISECLQNETWITIS